MALPLEEVKLNRRIAKITLKGARDKPGVAAHVFELLGEEGINVELIVQGPATRGRADIAFLVLESQIDKVKTLGDELLAQVGGMDLLIDFKVVLLSFYGGREFSKRPGVAGKIFDVLAQRGINIELISTSPDALSLVIREDRVEDAIEILKEDLGIEIEESY